MTQIQTIPIFKQTTTTTSTNMFQTNNKSKICSNVQTNFLYQTNKQTNKQKSNVATNTK